MIDESASQTQFLSKIDSSALRKLLDGILRTDADFDAFCLDEFRGVFHRFSKGMDRLQKQNLLLTLVDPVKVTEKLYHHHPTEVERILIEIEIKIPQPAGGTTPPTRPHGIGSGGPPSRSPNPAQLAMLIGILLGIVGLQVLFGRHVARSASILLLYLGLGLFSLVATAVAAWLGGAAGVFRTARARIVGPGAVLLAVLSMGIGSTKVLSGAVDEEWTLKGQIDGLPKDKPARVYVGDCLPAPVDSSSGQFVVQIHRACERDPFDVTIRVADFAEQRESISRDQAQNWLRLSFRASREINELTGRVVQNLPSGKPVKGAVVKLERCPDASRTATTNEHGEFLLPLPSGCRKVPYNLLVFEQEQVIPWLSQEAIGMVIPVSSDSHPSSAKAMHPPAPVRTASAAVSPTVPPSAMTALRNFTVRIVIDAEVGDTIRLLRTRDGQEMKKAVARLVDGIELPRLIWEPMLEEANHLIECRGGNRRIPIGVSMIRAKTDVHIDCK